jgi:hypothetical protein
MKSSPPQPDRPEDIADTVAIALLIEEKAGQIYHELARKNEPGPWRDFWQSLAVDEAHHYHLWQEVHQKAIHGTLRHFIEDVSALSVDLQKVAQTADDLIHKTELPSDPGNGLLMASGLEMLMVNPSLAFLLSEVPPRKDGVTAEALYARHLHKFSGAFNRLAENHPEFRLIAKMIDSNWQNNRHIARQLDQIRILRGLIPICSGCKKIRNDNGFWEQVESYFDTTMKAQFTHSLCPDCLARLYPDYPTESL